MTRELGGIEYRLVCAGYRNEGHKLHAYHVSPKRGKTSESRRDLEEDRTNDRINKFNPGCAPWRVEGRFITNWSDDFDWMDELEP